MPDEQRFLTYIPVVLTALSAIITIAGWFFTYKRQEEILKLQHNLDALKSIAEPKLLKLSFIEQWVIDGFEIYNEVKLRPLAYFLINEKNNEVGNSLPPKLDFSKIDKRYSTWCENSYNLILYAQIYNSKNTKDASVWGGEFDGKFPEDLPNLLELLKKLLGDYIWVQWEGYQSLLIPEWEEQKDIDPEGWDEAVEGRILEAGQYINPTFRKIYTALEDVRIYVTTELP